MDEKTKNCKKCKKNYGLKVLKGKNSIQSVECINDIFGCEVYSDNNAKFCEKCDSGIIHYLYYINLK